MFTDEFLDELARRVAEGVADRLDRRRAQVAAGIDEAHHDLEFIADRLSVGRKHLAKLCRQGRVRGAFRVGRTWRCTATAAIEALRSSASPRTVDIEAKARELLKGVR